MIARLRVKLPYAIFLVKEPVLTPFSLMYEGYEFLVYPPYKSKLPTQQPLFTAYTNIKDKLEYYDGEAFSFITVNNIETIEANAIQIEVKNKDFNRAIVTPDDYEKTDPPMNIFFNVVNKVLERIRCVTVGPGIKPLRVDETFWTLNYLNDSGALLEKEEGKNRIVSRGQTKTEEICLNKDMWKMVTELDSEFKLPGYEEIFLDALFLKNEVGPAIVLAYTSLETMIEYCLNIIVKSKEIPEGLWEWIGGKKRELQQLPTTDEKFDSLLKIFSGKSLKDKSKLWEAYKNLQTARNEFVHNGAAKVGGVVVTKERAKELSTKVRDIIIWLEEIMPEKNRLPRFKGGLETEIAYRVEL